jgi:hypothetical protein
MKIKEIAQVFIKAGVNVRPKALKLVQEQLEGIDEAIKITEQDVDMHDENNMKILNDPNSKITILHYIIRKFEEMRSYTSDTTNSFLEEKAVAQIFESITLDELQNLEISSQLFNRVHYITAPAEVEGCTPKFFI